LLPLGLGQQNQLRQKKTVFRTNIILKTDKLILLPLGSGQTKSAILLPLGSGQTKSAKAEKTVLRTNYLMKTSKLILHSAQNHPINPITNRQPKTENRQPKTENRKQKTPTEAGVFPSKNQP
jgi:hypothetical protein